ncbi:host transcription inhibitor [Acinetobacter phage vB_AbaM_DLP1]|nr:putative inhibitor of host transcription [Acinetobacter phage PhaR5]WBF78568.1 host transcription inhibitor [Acinetobacter phage vB_AbaM_DLP1]WBF78817.1 putative inhibitor of host transcription protein [Acinetobacter phage vB_AbaM_DLP2]
MAIGIIVISNIAYEENIMKHTVHTLTPEVLVEMFGDDKDWCSVLKNGKRVGYFSDLRKEVLKRQALADKKERKKFHDSLMLNDNIRETKRFFEDRLKNAHVFINETQPNVHLNGSKFYIICGATPKIRLGVTHKDLTFDEIVQLAEREARQSTSPRHALFSNLDLEEAAQLIELLAGN